MNNYTYQPPNDENTERAFLSYFINQGVQSIKLMTKIEKNVLYNPENVQIYSLIGKLIEEGTEVNMINLSIQAKNENKFELINNITTIGINAVYDTDIEQIITRLNRLYYQREALTLAAMVMTSVQNNDAKDAIDNVVEQFSELNVKMNANDATGLSNSKVLDQALSNIEKGIEDRENNVNTVIKTEISGLDFCIGGLYGGTLNVIAGRPGSGKTTLALQVAINISSCKNVDFYSYEMLSSDIMNIAIAKQAKDMGISRSDVRDYKLSKEQFKELNTKCNDTIRNNKITWNEGFKMNLTRLVSTIRSNHKNKGSELIVIDYLQLIPFTGSKQMREQQVSEMSRTLKTLALQLNIPIIVLSQLNRQADNEKPKSSHLRESGAIEQDADTIILAWRPSRDENGYERFNVQVLDDEGVENPICLVVDKSRRGETGDVLVKHDGQMTSIYCPNSETISAPSNNQIVQEVSNEAPFDYPNNTFDELAF